MDKRSKIIIVILTVFTILILFLSGWYFLLSFKNPFSKNTDEIQLYVQSPPSTIIGDTFFLIVSVENVSNDYIQVKEIRLPQELLEVAIVENIFPGTLNQTGYDPYSTGFEIDYLVEPNEVALFEVTINPWQKAVVSGYVTVITENSSTRTSLKIAIQEKVVLEPTTTPIPIKTNTPEVTVTSFLPSPTNVNIPYQSVVKITAKIKHSSYLKSAWGGSGTIISADGLILTNAHLVSPSKDFFADAYIISISSSEDKSPEETYYAEPVSVDNDLDLALLRIVMDIDQKPINQKTLNLPSVPLGDVNTLKLGDNITILGYPTIGGDTITLVRGDVSGFTAEYEYGDRAFIKTSAAIAAGTSGGLALDENGFFIAIPTQLGPGEGNEVVDCRVIADTNGDGDIDREDTCIPVGGFFNALRPINFAIPMIEEAQLSFSQTE
jgi:S1-C subfamily serine protease